ncbi:YcxB family protein [Micromonospora sp. NPDC050686]|uniref:YcxB family protein n=1 Tax=Micromonospora sp. NPDC050686 TaxID=3154631 RepID=UPI00340C394D
MTSEVTAGPIELRYTLTSDDLLDGIAAQLRGIRRRWLVALLTIPPLVGLAIGFVRAEVWELSAATVPILAVASLVLLLVTVGFSLLLSRVLLRWVYRWQARLILRGNPWLSQSIRAAVADTGVHVGNPAAESTSAWSQFPLYVETDRSFVLLASEKIGAVALVLPKRGLVGEDAAPLRALLDTHSNRRSRSWPAATSAVSAGARTPCMRNGAKPTQAEP